MKKSMAILLAIIIGISYCPAEKNVMAKQAGGGAANMTNASNIDRTGTNAESIPAGNAENTEDATGVLPKQSTTIPERELPDAGTDENTLEENPTNAGTDGNISELSGSGELEETSKEEGEKENKESGNPEEGQAGMKGLQIPQKLEVVIDQWGMDGKTQVYSDEYIIENTGDVAGALTLSGLAYKPQKGSGVSIKTDKKGLHDGSGKSIYMEMVFQKGKGKKERVVLSQQEAGYEVRLKPGEGLSIRFVGEVNEYASEPWEDDDIAVTAVYSWEEEMPDENGIEAEREEKPDKEGTAIEEETLENDKGVESVGTDGEDPGNGEGVKEDNMEDAPDSQNHQADGTGESGDGPGEAGLTDTDAGDSQAQEGSSGFGKDHENQTENIDLQAPEEWNMDVGFWTEGEGGMFLSRQYAIRNTGETTGVFILAGLACSLPEKEGAGGEDGAGTDAAHIEMVAGNGDRVALSGEPSEYKAELKPGEALSIWFEWKPDGELPEGAKGSSPAVTAAVSWDIPGSQKE